MAAVILSSPTAATQDVSVGRNLDAMNKVGVNPPAFAIGTISDVDHAAHQLRTLAQQLVAT